MSEDNFGVSAHLGDHGGLGFDDLVVPYMEKLIQRIDASMVIEQPGDDKPGTFTCSLAIVCDGGPHQLSELSSKSPLSSRRVGACNACNQVRTNQTDATGERFYNGGLDAMATRLLGKHCLVRRKGHC